MYPAASQDIGIDGARRLVVLVYADYGLGNPPAISDGRGRRRPCYSPRSHTIKLPCNRRYTLIVLHEIAHSIARERMGWHGPHFVKLVAELWERYAGIPQEVSRSIGSNQKPRKVLFDNPVF